MLNQLILNKLTLNKLALTVGWALCGLCFSVSVLSQTTDNAGSPESAPQLEWRRNQVLAQQIERNDKETQINWLGQPSEPFLTLYLSASNGSPRASLLILHGNRQHPDWPGLIHHVRTRLPETGWNTLSVAMPDLQVQFEPPVVQVAVEPAAPDEDVSENTSEPTATESKQEQPVPDSDSEPEAPPTSTTPPARSIYPDQEIPTQVEKRIDIAINELRSKSPLPVFILALGTGATLLQQQIPVLTSQRISGIILTNPAPIKWTDGQMAWPDATLFPMPVLDLTPKMNPASQPKTRKNAAARQRKRDYQQRIIPGSESDFNGSEETLIKIIRGWAKNWM